jgi:replicative DNA helicase
MDAETNIIGGLLIYPEEYSSALSELKTTDFDNPEFGLIFKSIQLIAKEKPDYTTPDVSAKLNKAYKATATRCAELFISTANYRGCVNIVLQQAQNRRIMQRLNDIVFSAQDEPLEELQKIIDSEKSAKPNYDYDGKQAEQASTYIGNLYVPDLTSKRIQTGLQRLDRALCGLRCGTMSIVGARPSVGKTSFALNVAQSQLDTDNTVDFFSLEMTSHQIYDRLLSSLLNINYGKINENNLNDGERGDMSHKLSDITSSKKLRVFEDTYTIEGIAKTISDTKPQLVVVDYIQVVRTMEHFRDKRLQIDYISSEFKRLAKQYDCHIMVLSQIARAGADAPKMSDLKESGGLEADGDYIMLLHRPYVNCKDGNYKPEDSSILLDKNKFGNTGVIDTLFKGQFQQWHES